MKAAGFNRAERRRRARKAPGTINWKPVTALALTLTLGAIIAIIALVNAKNVPQSASEAPIVASLRVGDPAPSFSVTTINGEHIDSATIAKPILLEGFATWCPHCQRETKSLNALQARLGDRLAIVAVSASDTAADRTSPASLDDVRTFAQYFNVTYPIAYDPDLAVAKKYLQGGFPTVVFIDRAKRVTAIATGEVSLQRLIKEAQKAGA